MFPGSSDYVPVKTTHPLTTNHRTIGVIMFVGFERIYFKPNVAYFITTAKNWKPNPIRFYLGGSLQAEIVVT